MIEAKKEITVKISGKDVETLKEVCKIADMEINRNPEKYNVGKADVLDFLNRVHGVTNSHL